MELEKRFALRFDELLSQAPRLAMGHGTYGHVSDRSQKAECVAWLMSAAQLTAALIADEGNIYRRRMDDLGEAVSSSSINDRVEAGAAILRRLREDVQNGFFGSVEDRASANTFDDLLEHAEAYMSDGRIEPAAVLAGVVFEDSARRVFRTTTGESDKDIQLDTVIARLKQLPADGPVLSRIDAKQAIAAAGVRTSATHAQWDEISRSNVEATIKFTREFINNNLMR
jgi:hypothetical protein